MAFQVGEKKQTERALAFFDAQAVCRQKHAGQRAETESEQPDGDE